MSLNRIDHVMICPTTTLEEASESYRKLGFSLHSGGTPSRGTHNALSFHQEDYLELSTFTEREEYLRLNPSGGLAKFIDAGGGLRFIVLQSSDLKATVQAMKERGVDVNDPIEGSRTTPDGTVLRWKLAVLGNFPFYFYPCVQLILSSHCFGFASYFLPNSHFVSLVLIFLTRASRDLSFLPFFLPDFFSGPKNPLPLLFIEHLTPLEERRAQVPTTDQPNGVLSIERVYISVPDLQEASEIYAKVLGIPVPPKEKGNVILSDMYVFPVGPTGLAIAQPYGDQGPCSESIRRRGYGPFQILFRTSSIGVAATWMDSEGLPPPVRGVRNTGEEALLVDPSQACGLYVAFVGPKQ
jgi:catechol 2,3-dioxygenase-like lactoylglutathione lyase family enzyme